MTATLEQWLGYALHWVGITPYVYGGASPSGADCSGYVQFTAAWAGIGVARTTQGEWATLPPGNGSRGDLVLFDVPADGPPQPQHVGICLGNGTMVNAPHAGTYVQINPIWNIPGSITVMGYRRIPGFAEPPPLPPPPIASGPTEEEIMSATVVNGVLTIERVSPQGHLLVFSATPQGWSVVDVTDAIQAANPGTQPYLVQS